MQQNTETREGSALERLAELKGLSVGFLMEHGFTDAPNREIRISYGLDKRARMRRRAETSKDNFYWDTLEPSLPMCAFTNQDFKKVGGTVYLVEGEIDTVTGWSHNIWTVGIPGATMTNVLQPSDVDGAESAIVIQESGEAGTRFPYRVGQRLRDVGFTGKIVAASFGRYKDLNELHLSYPGQSSFMLRLSQSSKETVNVEPRTTVVSAAPADDKGRALQTRCLSDVVEADVRWLWPGRIPYAKVTLLVGDPGIGKSYASVAIAARLTNGGTFPDSQNERREPQAVLMWNGEDAAEDTIRPRARKCSANLELFEVIDGVRDKDGKVLPFGLNDVNLIAELVSERGNVGLLVIDPLNAVLRGVDSHRAVEVHSALQPLADLAKATGMAVLIVAHLNKKESIEALYRVSGSIAFSALPRAGLLCHRDPEDPTRRFIAPLKNNNAKDAQTVEYGIDHDGTFWFGRTSTHTAQTLLRAPKYGGVKDKAERFLREILADGPVPSLKVFELAAERGLHEKSVKRAKDSIGVQSDKVGKTWMFSLADAKRDIST